MSLESCSLEALNAKVITKEMADELVSGQIFDEKEIIDAALSAAYLKRRQAALQIVKQTESLAHAKGFKRRKIAKSLKARESIIENDFLAGVDSLVTRDMYSQTGTANIKTIGDVIEGQFDSKIGDILHTYKSKWFGLTQDKAGLQRLIRAMYGSADDAGLAKMAGDLGAVFEDARIMFNKAGGAIRKLDGYMPQSHNAIKMLKYPADALKSQKEWVNFMMNEVKIRPLTDDFGKVLPPAEQIEVLNSIFDTLSTEGVSKMEAGKFSGTGKLANKHMAERILHFEDADSWLKYHEIYGSDDILAAMTGYLTGMSKDIAAMEVLGPNPTLTHNFLLDTAKIEGANNMAIGMAENVYKAQTGYNNLHQDIQLAYYSGEAKAFTSGTMLGSAMLSSIGDPVMTAVTARYNGLPITKMLMSFVKNLSKVEDSARLATELGFIANTAKGKMLALAKLSGEGQMGTGVGSKTGEVVLRSSGLTAWTETLRTTYSTEASRSYAKAMKKSYSKLNPRMRKQFEKFGITEADWEIIRATKPTEIPDGKFLTGQSIVDSLDNKELGRNLQRKYMSLILQEAEYAAVTPDAKVASMLGGAHKGTIGGEMASHTAAFKSFPVTMLLTHMSRAMQEESLKGGLGYLGAIMVGTTMMGAAALQLKELSKGRELRSTNDQSFWAQAMLQGGGLGLFGDLLFQDTTRFGQTLLGSVGGPSLDMGANFVGGTFGTLKDVIYDAPFGEGDWRDVLGESVGDIAIGLEKYNPIDTWYTKLAFERLLIEPLAGFADPTLKGRLQKKDNRNQGSFGNGMFWPRGEAPSLPTNAGHPVGNPIFED